MRKIYHQIFILSMGFCLLTAFATGCTKANRNAQYPNQNNLVSQGQNNIGGTPTADEGASPRISNTDGTRISLAGDTRFSNTPGSGTDNNNVTIQGNQTGFDSRRADNIRSRLTDTYGMTPGNVIVNGNTCLVGYDASYDAREMDSLNEIIFNSVKKIDPNITNVVVSNSADMNTRMNLLSTDIINSAGNIMNDNRIMVDLNGRFNQLIQDINNFGR